jgi:hypothetical protein
MPKSARNGGRGNLASKSPQAFSRAPEQLRSWPPRPELSAPRWSRPVCARRRQGQQRRAHGIEGGWGHKNPLGRIQAKGFLVGISMPRKPLTRSLLNAGVPRCKVELRGLGAVHRGDAGRRQKPPHAAFGARVSGINQECSCEGRVSDSRAEQARLRQKVAGAHGASGGRGHKKTPASNSTQGFRGLRRQPGLWLRRPVLPAARRTRLCCDRGRGPRRLSVEPEPPNRISIRR